ncbi:MAG: GNAT family N-acetyltransferase [Planctomycetes bacterium]|nr:GNAT family N-acetyltransferase [Planctomycetota bacterium]
MSESLTQLCATDFDEAISHLNLVFGDPDFAALLPRLYQPSDEHMSCNYAIRRDGRIVAIVGLFPISWVVAGEHLRLAGVGGVSVHPEHRGRGYMRVLMDAVMGDIARGGYHAACLGGNRRRYAHWGFEKAGVEASFLVTPNSLQHAPLGIGMGPAPRTERCSQSDLDAMRALYNQQSVRCERSAEHFPLQLAHWRREAWVTRDPSGRAVAYGCIDPKDFSCVDLCAQDADSLELFVRAQVLGAGKNLRVSMPLLQTPQFARIANLSDDVSLIEASNWRIYDWPAVLGALLRAKHAAQPLPAGACVLRITDADETVRLEVDGEARCTRTSAAADLEADSSEMLRLLASPIPADRPGGRTDWLAWRPLPLMIPMQDRI